jgi:hypothetical protein
VDQSPALFKPLKGAAQYAAEMLKQFFNQWPGYQLAAVNGRD